MDWTKIFSRGIWFYPVCLIMTVILYILSPVTDNRFIWLYLGTGAIFLWTVRPQSTLYKTTLEKFTWKKKVFFALTVVITIAACTLPMGKIRIWNGEDPGHRNQYELMAEVILDGHIDLRYGDEKELSKLENPYDPEEREESGVKFHWDHAFYDGHYYMYFGVVPVFLLFLPYRIITGMPLTTYHATQIFVAAAIIGIFTVFYLLSKLFFKKISYCVYLALSVAFSVMSVWYSIAQPALYCTAITSAIALETWSLYFYIRAVWREKRENRQIVFAFIGAVLGALAFGCRPPIALTNILVVPMLITFLRQRKITFKLFGKLLIAALPYVIVAAALMAYNYIRFDNPFEFGQAYQLTVADQTQYQVTLNLETINRIARDTIRNFFDWGNISTEFPYLRPGSMFFNFPVLLLCFGIFRTSVIEKMRQLKIVPFMIVLFLTILIIVAADIMWSPYLLERYRMDIYFLMGIGCFIVTGLWQSRCTVKQRQYLNFGLLVLSGMTIISAFLFYVYTIGNDVHGVVSVIADFLHLL